MCTVAYLRQCAEKNKGSASTWLRRFAALLHVFSFFFFHVFFSEGFFYSSLTVSLSGRGCHTTDRHHKEGQREEKKIKNCSQPAEVVIDGTLNKNRGRKAHFLPSCGIQKPLSWRRGKESIDWLSFSVVYRQGSFFVFSFCGSSGEK